MNYIWRPLKKFTKGAGVPKTAVVLHVDLGTEEGTYNWLSNGPTSASYHFYINKKGDIIQFVEEGDVAWHSGRVYQPRPEAEDFFKKVNPNTISIGICYEGMPIERVTGDNKTFTDGEYANKDQVHSCVKLIEDLNTRHDIQAIFAHKEIASYKPNSVLKFKDDVQHNLNSRIEKKDIWVEIKDIVARLEKIEEALHERQD